MSELVQTLCVGEHPLTVSLRPERSVAAFKACLDRGYVLVRFTDTRGGTEVGFATDPMVTDCSAADFDAESGAVTLGGTFTLDYVRVRCLARVELPSLAGTGHLEELSSAEGTRHVR